MKLRKTILTACCLSLVFLAAGCGQKQSAGSTAGSEAQPQGTSAEKQGTSAETQGYYPTSGWRTSTPEAQGLSSAVIAEAIEAHQGRNLHSVAIVRNGYLVAEAYNQQTQADKPQDLRSVTKSFVSALTGIALSEHKLSALSEKVAQYVPAIAADPAKAGMQIGHLLYMASGMDWVNDEERSTIELMSSPNWLEFIGVTKQRTEPGTVYHYSNADAHLMSAVLQKATGQTLYDYAKAKIFEPLGITASSWKQDPQGYSIGAWSLELTARDLAKFGYLYLNNGSWEGRSVVPSIWIDESWKERVPQKFDDGTEGGYGYFWWMKSLSAEGEHAKLDVKYAAGSEGQRLYLVPELDLIVVITGDNRTEENMPLDLFNALAKSVKSDAALPESAEGTAKLSQTIEAFKMVADHEEPGAKK